MLTVDTISIAEILKETEVAIKMGVLEEVSVRVNVLKRVKDSERSWNYVLEIVS